MRKINYVIFGIIIVLVILFASPVLYKICNPPINEENWSLVYYQNTENYSSEFSEICKKIGGVEPNDGFGEYYNLYCLNKGGEICTDIKPEEKSPDFCDRFRLRIDSDMKPMEEFRNFCDKIDGDSRCYNNYKFVCVPPPNPEDEFTFCIWNLWEPVGCDMINKYKNKQCETNSDCGVGAFPCHEGKCLIKRCKSDRDCGEYWCGSHTAHPHGYCLTGIGDI